MPNSRRYMAYVNVILQSVCIVFCAHLPVRNVFFLYYEDVKLSFVYKFTKCITTKYIKSIAILVFNFRYFLITVYN